MPYEVYRGQILGPEELAELRRRIEQFGKIAKIDDDMRALILRNWPDLAARLPAEDEE
jgi:hypothetical protein